MTESSLTQHQVTFRHIRLIGMDRDDIETLRRAVRVNALPEGLRIHFQHPLRREVFSEHSPGELHAR